MFLQRAGYECMKLLMADQNYYLKYRRVYKKRGALPSLQIAGA